MCTSHELKQGDGWVTVFLVGKFCRSALGTWNTAEISAWRTFRARPEAIFRRQPECELPAFFWAEIPPEKPGAVGGKTQWLLNQRGFWWKVPRCGYSRLWFFLFIFFLLYTGNRIHLKHHTHHVHYPPPGKAAILWGMPAMLPPISPHRAPLRFIFIYDT